MAFAEWLHTMVLLPVPHRQIVLTIPKMLRIFFRYDRRLLGDLCRVAAGVIVESFRLLLALPRAQPGLVVCVHTYGDLANHHPHRHVTATDGAFTPDGGFHALPMMSLARMEDRLRYRVCKMLVKKGRLGAERAKLREAGMASAENYAATHRLGADDATGRENIARYLIRAPFSAERITYNAAAQTTGANGNEVLFDPLDFIAAVTSHIPNHGEHLFRYYSSTRECSGAGAIVSRWRSSCCDRSRSRPQTTSPRRRPRAGTGPALSRTCSNWTHYSARIAEGS